jgi:hypothetical protein
MNLELNNKTILQFVAVADDENRKIYLISLQNYFK